MAVLSFFVYGYQFEPVILCLIYCYLSSSISDAILKGGKSALKFEVITRQPEALSHQLMDQLHHGVTVLQAEGMYSETPRYLLICVVNRHQVVRFQEVLSPVPGYLCLCLRCQRDPGQLQAHRIANTSGGRGLRWCFVYSVDRFSRSSGNGGMANGFTARLISTVGHRPLPPVGVEHAADPAAVDDGPLAAFPHPDGHGLHGAAAVGGPVAGLVIQMDTGEAVGAVIPVLGCRRPGALPASRRPGR